MEQSVYWRDYLNQKKVHVDLEYIREELRVLKRKKREIKKEGVIGELNQIKYKITSLNNLVEHTEGFRESDCLEASEYLRGIRYREGVLYPEYAVGETFRLYSSQPSLGNLSKSLRKAVVAGQSRRLAKVDFKSQESWIMMNVLECPELRSFFEEGDFYDGLKNQLGLSLSRDQVKKYWTSFVYGYQNQIDVTEVQTIRNYIDNHQIIQLFKEELIEDVRDKGYVSGVRGSKRYIPYQGRKSERVAFNNFFQISGAEVLYYTLDQVKKSLGSREMDDQVDLLLTNHDEFVMEVSRDITEDDMYDLLGTVSYGKWMRPKFHVSIGENWGE